MPDSFRPVALEHASRLVNHGPTVLVTSAAGARRNVMAAAWSMPVEFTPPRIAVVIDKHTFTRELVIASGSFGICLPGTVLADLTYSVGSQSGRDVDKFALHGIVARPGPVLGVPLMTGVLDYGRGRYAEAVESLWSVRDVCHRFGGSHAQRDLVDQTLMDAAIRAGQPRLARHLLNERLLAKARSPLTQHWAGRVGGR